MNYLNMASRAALMSTSPQDVRPMLCIDIITSKAQLVQNLKYARVTQKRTRGSLRSCLFVGGGGGGT